MVIWGTLITPLSIKNTVLCISVTNNKYIFCISYLESLLKINLKQKKKLNILISFGDIGILKNHKRLG